MIDKRTLNPKDRTFILKMIMVAEMSTPAYKYLVRNPDLFDQVERESINEFPEDYMRRYKDKDGNVVAPPEGEKEVLSKVLQLIRTSPKIADISLPLSEVFELVGFFEEELEEATKFNSLAATNPEEALKFLKTITWDFEPRVRSLTAEISQNVGQITFDPTSPDDNQRSLLTQFRNRVKTELLVFSEYSKKEAFIKIVKDISRKFFELLPSLDARLSPALGDLESDFLGSVLGLAPEKFWEDYLAIPKFTDFSNFKNLVIALDKQRLQDSETVKPLFTKISGFLEPNFDLVIPLIKSAELLKAKSAVGFKEQLVTFFASQTDANRREVMFNLFKGDVQILESCPGVFDDLFAKAEYARINKLLTDERLRGALIATRSKHFRDFLLQTADFNNAEFLRLFSNVWEQRNIDELMLLESESFTSLSEKISQVTDSDLRQQYVDELLKQDLGNFIVKTGAQRIYINGLKVMRPNMTSTSKRRMTSFIKKLKGGGKYGRRKKAKPTTKKRGR